MFYSHEILTQREHGIATVWLVATLGAKSSSKKINKKALLDVNVPKACHAVTEPRAPMALRLSSNLLIGISRVFLSQCGYVLADTESIHHAMRALLKVIRESQLDPNAGKSRPDQLILGDDPAFVPEVMPELDMDFAMQDLSSSASSLRSSHASKGSHRSSLTSQGSQDGGFNIVIPSDASPSSGRDPVPRDRESRDRQSFGLDDDLGLLPDVGFEFDAEGNLIDTFLEDILSPGRRASEAESADRLPGGAGAAAPGAQDHANELNMQQDELDFVLFDDPEDLLQAPEMSPLRNEQEEQLEEVEEEPNAMTVAPARKARVARPLKTDERQDLKSSELQAWQSDYLANMQTARKHRDAKRTATTAKRFAAACVFGNGLAGLGQESDIMRESGPLAMFAGDNLRTMVFGNTQATESRGKKRKSTDDEQSDNEQRKTRRKSDDVELERAIEDDSMPTFEDDIEQGRDAAEALEDISSQMPWNVPSSQAGGSRAGSRPGSVRPPSRAGSVAIGSVHGPIIPFSAGGLPSSATSDLQQLRKSRRPPSASPSRDHGRFHDAGRLAMGDDTFDGTNNSALDDFELYGPAAGVDTQTAGHDDWIDGALRKEEERFLDFVDAEMERSGKTEITFEQLVPTETNNQIVAAQAFLHVLGLASKGVLEVTQDEGFCAPIQLSTPMAA